MLVLSRRQQEQIRIGNDITITILRVKGQTVRVGIDAPRDIHVIRGELKKREFVVETRISQADISEAGISNASIARTVISQAGISETGCSEAGEPIEEDSSEGHSRDSNFQPENQTSQSPVDATSTEVSAAAAV